MVARGHAFAQGIPRAGTEAITMTVATLLQLSGVELPPPAARSSALVLIDAQEWYRTGPLALPALGPALASAALALERARTAGVPVVHVVHHGRAGTLLDAASALAAILPEVAPRPAEPVVAKRLPSAFTGTRLAALLQELGVTTPVLAGFMTHMCVSSTARAAAELGFSPWVVRDACAARPIPDGRGGVLDAETVHRAHLASLADRFAGLTDARELWP
jgi:nicotinamidase-related amidase